MSNNETCTPMCVWTIGKQLCCGICCGICVGCNSTIINDRTQKICLCLCMNSKIIAQKKDSSNTLGLCCNIICCGSEATLYNYRCHDLCCYIRCHDLCCNIICCGSTLSKSQWTIACCRGNIDKGNCDTALYGTIKNSCCSIACCRGNIGKGNCSIACCGGIVDSSHCSMACCGAESNHSICDAPLCYKKHTRSCCGVLYGCCNHNQIVSKTIPQPQQPDVVPIGIAIVRAQPQCVPIPSVKYNDPPAYHGNA